MRAGSTLDLHLPAIRCRSMPIRSASRRCSATCSTTRRITAAAAASIELHARAHGGRPGARARASTTASASIRTRCRTSSNCSPRASAHPAMRRAASASAWRWCASLVEQHGGRVRRQQSRARTGRGILGVAAAVRRRAEAAHRGLARSTDGARRACACWSSTTTRMPPIRWRWCSTPPASTHRVVHDGPTALAAADAFLPDVVLLDIGMPGMDGYEVARRLRAHPDHAHALLVAFTGWSYEQDQARIARRRLRPPPAQTGRHRRTHGPARHARTGAPARWTADYVSSVARRVGVHGLPIAAPANAHG